MRASCLLLAAVLIIQGAPAARAQVQEDVAAGGLPPIESGYKARIVAWAGRTFAAPRALRAAEISDPGLIRDGTGRLLWLVCIQVVNDAATARSAAPERFAFGFAPGYFSAPLQRVGATLRRTDCDGQALVFRPFRELGRAGADATVPRGDRRTGHR